MSDLERELRELGERTSERLGAPTAPEWVPRKARRRRIAAAIGSGALTLSLLAGGAFALSNIEGGTESVDSNVLVAAADATRAQGTARSTLVMKMRVDAMGFDQEFETKGVGHDDFTRNRSYMTLTTDSSMGKFTMETIRDGLDIYTKGQPGTDPDKWQRTDMSWATGSAGSPGTTEDYLEYLRSVSGDVAVIGTEEMDGVTATHYRAELSEDAFKEQIDEQMPSDVADLFDSYEIDLSPMEVWVDANDLMRRMDFAMKIAYEMNSSEFHMEMDVSTRTFDFGAPVEIEIPDEKDVVDAPGAFGNNGSEALEETLKAWGDGDADMVDTLVGEQGLVGPALGMIGHEPSVACVGGAPLWATEVKLVSLPDGVPQVETELTPEGDEAVGCFMREDFSHELRDALLSDPDSYGLLFKGDGRQEEMPFTEALGLPVEDSD